MPRKYVIYGGSGGIGSATARLLRDRGDELHLVGRDEAKLQAIATELDCGHTVGDVTDDGLFARVAADAGGPLSGLVYAVGSINLRGLARLEEEDFVRDFRVNAAGAALAVRSAASALRKGGAEQPASVVFYSSVAAQQGFTFHASMGMAKGAVNGLTLSLAAELAPRVRVNAIAPSLTRTPMAEGIVANEKMAESLAALHPLPRLGTADEIAGLTAFLLSDDASWITGQVLSVDGGRSTVRIKS